MGLEPMISRTTIWRANQLHHTHHITYRTVFCPTKYHHIKFSGLNEPGGIRTLDLRLRRPLLYPAELQTLKDKLLRTITFPNVCWHSESGWWESNPRIQLGRLVFYHWTTPARLSGWQDSNLRPPGPKPGALAKLSHTPILFTSCHLVVSPWHNSYYIARFEYCQ